MSMARLIQDPERVHRRRVIAGLTMLDLANRAGISKGTMSRIEGGRGSASVQALHQLARALECDVTDLMPPEGSWAGGER